MAKRGPWATHREVRPLIQRAMKAMPVLGQGPHRWPTLLAWLSVLRLEALQGVVQAADKTSGLRGRCQVTSGLRGRCLCVRAHVYISCEARGRRQPRRQTSAPGVQTNTHTGGCAFEKRTDTACPGQHDVCAVLLLYKQTRTYTRTRTINSTSLKRCSFF